jgi:hypothetical protein
MKRLGLLCCLMLLFATNARTQNSTPPTAIVPIASAIDSGCTPTCTYTDVTPPPGQHFYFVLAYANGYYSVSSNSVNVTVPAGNNPATGKPYSVTLSWTASTSQSSSLNVVYLVYRGAPATAPVITNSH